MEEAAWEALAPNRQGGHRFLLVLVHQMVFEAAERKIRKKVWILRKTPTWPCATREQTLTSSVQRPVRPLLLGLPGESPAIVQVAVIRKSQSRSGIWVALDFPQRAGYFLQPLWDLRSNIRQAASNDVAKKQ